MANEIADDLAIAIIEHFFKISSQAVPTHVSVALSTADPTADGSGLAEPSGGSYARVNCDGWTRSGRSASNTAKVDFGTATGSWGTITHVALMNGSDFMLSSALTTSKAVANGDPVEFPIGDLTITF